MEIKFFQVETYTDKIFNGIPVSVMVLERWLDEGHLMKLACRNREYETVFVVDDGRKIQTRFFWGETEFALSASGAMAAAFVLKKNLLYPDNRLCFTAKNAKIEVIFNDKSIILIFPSKNVEYFEMVPGVYHTIHSDDIEFTGKTDDLFIVLKNEDALFAISSDMFLPNSAEFKGIIISAYSGDSNFSARYYSLKNNCFKEVTTGDSLCALVPFWSKKIGKKNLSVYEKCTAHENIECTIFESNISISGRAVLFMEGVIKL